MSAPVPEDSAVVTDNSTELTTPVALKPASAQLQFATVPEVVWEWAVNRAASAWSSRVAPWRSALGLPEPALAADGSARPVVPAAAAAAAAAAEAAAKWLLPTAVTQPGTLEVSTAVVGLTLLWQWRRAPTVRHWLHATAHRSAFVAQVTLLTLLASVVYARHARASALPSHAHPAGTSTSTTSSSIRSIVSPSLAAAAAAATDAWRQVVQAATPAWQQAVQATTPAWQHMVLATAPALQQYRVWQGQYPIPPPVAIPPAMFVLWMWWRRRRQI